MIIRPEMGNNGPIWGRGQKPKIKIVEKISRQIEWW